MKLEEEIDGLYLTIAFAETMKKRTYYADEALYKEFHRLCSKLRLELNAKHEALAKRNWEKSKCWENSTAWHDNLK